MWTWAAYTGVDKASTTSASARRAKSAIDHPAIGAARRSIPHPRAVLGMGGWGHARRVGGWSGGDGESGERGAPADHEGPRDADVVLRRRPRPGDRPLAAVPDAAGWVGGEPDVLFVPAAHLDRLKPTYLDGPPDLTVEIVSPESAGPDRGDKF